MKSSDLAKLIDRFLNAILVGKLREIELLRFVVIAGMYSLVSYAVYLSLLKILSYPVSFTISYVVGILLSYYLNSKVVFGVKLNLKKFVVFPLIYIVRYFLNMFFLYFQIEILKFNKRISFIVAALILVPVTFILSRTVLRREVP
jgi:putative flippase GtrA